MSARLLIAGTASGVGKTTITTGLIAAFRRRGLMVRCFGYFTHPRHFGLGDRSGGTTIVVIEPAQDREGDNAPDALAVWSRWR